MTRPVSPEAAPCEHIAGYDDDGNCWDCGKEIYVWPAEAAPPRATTPRVIPNADSPVLGQDDRGLLPMMREAEVATDSYGRVNVGVAVRELEALVGQYGDANALGTQSLQWPKGLPIGRAIARVLATAEACARASLAPSRESGALLDAYRDVVRRLARGHDLREFDKFGLRHEVEEARATVDDHIASLERDAARMREAATWILRVYDDGSDFKHPGSPAMERLRAALAPSGEPTTTPGSNVQL